MPSISRTVPDSRSGTGTLSGAAPHSVLTPWLRVMMMPNVANTCSRWSRPYKWRNTSSSSARPNASAAGSVSARPHQKLPVQAQNIAAR